MKFETDYLKKLKAELESRFGCRIDVVEDRTVAFPVKLEYARNYGRDSHVLRVNPDKCVNGYPRFVVDTNRILNLMFAMKCGEGSAWGQAPK